MGLVTHSSGVWYFANFWACHREMENFPFQRFLKMETFKKIYPSKFYYVVNKLMMANISDIMI